MPAYLNAHTHARDIGPSSITVFFNGACPVCRAAIDRYRALMGERRDFLWRDLRYYPDALAAFGIDRDEAARCVHVIDRTGALRKGVDGAIALWREMPGKRRWRARVLSLPLVHALAGWFYRRGIVPWAAHGATQGAAHDHGHAHDHQH